MLKHRQKNSRRGYVLSVRAPRRVMMYGHTSSEIEQTVTVAQQIHPCQSSKATTSIQVEPTHEGGIKFVLQFKLVNPMPG